MKLARGAVLLSLSLSLSLTSYAEAPGVFAITSATIHPVSGPSVAKGVVVIRGGLIEAAGANVTIPADATVIDAPGAHVYPGLIDAFTSLGFATGVEAGSSSERPAEPTPATMASRRINLTTGDLDARRITGVTTVVTAPAVGIFAGQSVVLNLSEGDPHSRVLRDQAAMHAAFRPRPAWTYPDSLMGVVAYLRQTFYDAQHHAAARAAYERNPAQPRPTNSPSLEALLPVIRREMPLVMEADSAESIRRAQSIAREFNLRLIVAGARQAWKNPEALRETPVLVSVNWQTAPAAREDREEQPLRVIRDRVNAPTTPSVLARHGVPFALVSGSGRAADYLSGIRRAIAEGLSEADALRAVTLTPARLFGVDAQIGSLERGKIANVVVTDRPIFERSSRVTRLFVDGREVRPQAGEETRESSVVNGTWNLTVRAPEGNVSVIVTLRVETGHVSGTYTGDRGSGDITGGIFHAPTVQFTIAAQSDAETHDWVFRGTVEESEMEGTVSTNLGTLQFSGSKPR